MLSPDGTEIWCVHERHEDGKVSRAIVAVPLDGSAADHPDAIRQLVTGTDFIAFPTPSPDGRRLAWICWNHPHMPWDGTELRVASVENGVPGQGRLVKGGLGESVLAPAWRDNSSLYVATDWTGWWNIYQVGLAGEPPQALYPAEEEFAGPLWQLGGRPFGVLSDGRLAVLHGRGSLRLGLLDPETFDLTDVDMPLSVFMPTLSADGTVIVGAAGGPAEPLSVFRVDVATSRTEILQRESEEPPDARFLPVPRQVDLEGRFGRVVHALVYPPANPDAAGPPGELPPFVVWVHGGPTVVRGRAARYGEGVLHQPGHRDHRRELRRLHRLRPAVPGTAAPAVGGGRRRGRRGGRRAGWSATAWPTRTGWRSAAARRAAGRPWPR